MDEISIPMKMRLWPMLLCLLFFGPGAYFLFFAVLEAEPGERSEPLMGFVICCLFAVVPLFLMVAGRRNPQALVLGRDEIRLPRGMFSKRAPRIRYDEIRSMDEMKVSGQRFLAFDAISGSYTISAIMLPRNVPLSEIKQQITRRAAIARGVGVR
ncbi:hypothetical protein [Gymnodinialimonas hymeniacidonis]|uniref:hypothetical protein n=1 Tax=Gymnodinialimonas hymeniacidonis TaxID=3126508 RepID=UPI0034C5BC0E